MSFNDWECIDNGAFNGVKKYIRDSDDDEGTVQVKYEGHDWAPIVEANKAAQNAHGGRLPDGLVHAATIPASVLLRWYVTDGIWATDDLDYMCRKLNDPDWRYLKRLPIQL